MPEIIQSNLTEELKKLIYENFANNAIDSIGFNGLDQDPFVLEYVDGNASLGICVCQLFWGNLHIKYLFVDKKYRKIGIAKTLIDYACSIARKKKCNFLFVETMSFQAPEFYQKLGFKIELIRDGYAGNTSFYYLKKLL